MRMFWDIDSVRARTSHDILEVDVDVQSVIMMRYVHKHVALLLHAHVVTDLRHAKHHQHYGAGEAHYWDEFTKSYLKLHRRCAP